MQAQSATTFLFTDIEGSTVLWERDPERMRPALARHDAIAREAVDVNHGIVVKMVGDGLHAAFDDPRCALNAALAMQIELADETKTNGVALKLRCGLHIGVTERRDNDYFGNAVNRAARIMSAAHGGQVLLSQALADRVRDLLPAAVSLRDLGGVRLKDLGSPEHVYQLVHPELRREFPALRSLEATPNNLPQQVTTFIGREGELFEVKRLLKQCRLLTITGPGGIGKTRLALQVAADTLDAYPDGVWLVELGSIADPSLVPTSVAQTLSVQEQMRAPLTQTLCGHLKSRCLLLVLDNCEHLITGCAELAAALLAAAPDIRVLASSREPLHVTGEQNFPLRPLSLPAADAPPETFARAEAVQLFVERVRSQQPGFVLTDREAPAVATLCAHLDGIPLALELAAARVRTLSIDEINVRLNDRFKLLTGGIRTALPRQQTLRATLDWSYELLPSQERTLLNRIAMFPGGFTLHAASSVAADEAMDDFAVIDLISHLVARSLVGADTHAAGMRYRLLETTRAYALEKLAEAGQTATVARRHARHFRESFERASDDWLRMSDDAWRAAYAPELDNVRAALDWAQREEGDPVIGIALAGASGSIWVGLSLTSEGRQRLEAAVPFVGEQTPAVDQARLWFWLGQLWGQTAPGQAVAAMERAIDFYRRLGDTLGLGYSLVRLGGRLAVMGRFERAARVLAEALPPLEQANVPKALASYFRELGFLKMLTNDAASARIHFEKALSLYRGAGADHFALITVGNLADVAWALGDVNAALSGFRETVALMRRTPTTTRSTLGANLANLAGVLTERGELDAALTAAREGLSLLQEGGYAWLFADHAALRAALAGNVASAARVAGFVDAAHAAKEATRQPNEARARERLQAILREKLSSHELERLLAEGAKFSEDEACRVALEA